MRNLSGLNDLNSFNNLSGLNDLFILILSKKMTKFDISINPGIKNLNGLNDLKILKNLSGLNDLYSLIS